MQTWKLQDAKAKLSEVVKDATTDGPQMITLRGQPVVVVISIDAFDKLMHPKPTFVAFMRQSPLAQVQIDIERDQSLTRDVDL